MRVDFDLFIGVATYFKVGGHTYEGVERPSWGSCVKNFSFSRTLKLPLTHTKAKAVLPKVWQLIN